MGLINLIDFPVLGDERGSLIALESHNQVPFDIKRVYYISDTAQGVARGFHAHKALKQVAICLNGSCRFVMDDGFNKEEVVLNSSCQGIFIDLMQWHEMYDFSANCILLVLASDTYDESDYIRDYDTFLSLIKDIT